MNSILAHHSELKNSKIANAIVSVHDVMPETVQNTGKILDTLSDLGIARCTLLVVPGRTWSERQIELLKQWQGLGYKLAGHGWLHECPVPKKLYHRMHSLLISRRVAEHLALDEAEILGLIRDCHAWFPENGLNAPDLYVPPAWAMGCVKFKRLAETPFRYFECLGGVYDARTGSFKRLPLSGYEADTPMRALFLSILNSANTSASRITGETLRISIHPYDFDHKISTSLYRHLSSIEKFHEYDSKTLASRETPFQYHQITAQKGAPHED